MRKILFLLITIIVVPKLHGGSLADEDLTPRLNVFVSSYSMEAQNFVQAMVKLSSQYKIPIGIEWIGDPSGSRKAIAFTFKHGKVGDLLRYAVSTQRGYTASVENGVFHVYPTTARNNTLDFLNIRFSTFDVDNTFVAVAGRRLKSEIRRRVYAENANTQESSDVSGTAGSLAIGAGDRRITLKLKDLAVRDILDHFLISSDFRVWLVTFSDNGQLTRAGMWKSGSLWNSEVSDEYQPVWDLLTWGFDPVTKNYRGDEWIRPVR